MGHLETHESIIVHVGVIVAQLNTWGNLLYALCMAPLNLSKGDKRAGMIFCDIFDASQHATSLPDSYGYIYTHGIRIADFSIIAT